jgi:hypothetical protein
MRAAQLRSWATKTAEEKRERTRVMNIAKAAKPLKEKKPPNIGVPREFRHIKKSGRVADVPSIARLADALGAA